jgi:two-component SAPR family response regulator
LQLIAVKKPCPRNEQELQKAYKSSMIEELNRDHEDLYNYLTKHTGQNVSNITAVEFLYNTLEIEASSSYIMKIFTVKTHVVVFWVMTLCSDVVG